MNDDTITIEWSKCYPIVIIETDEGLKMVEFELGEWEKANTYATQQAMACESRAIVAMRLRTCGSFTFLQKHGRLD